MGRQPPPPSAKLVLLSSVSAEGLGLVAVGVTTATGWEPLVPGFIALLVCLPWIWMVQKRRGECVFVAIHGVGRGKGSGIDIDANFYMVVALRDGKFQHFKAYSDRDQARAAAGLTDALPL